MFFKINESHSAKSFYILSISPTVHSLKINLLHSCYNEYLANFLICTLLQLLFTKRNVGVSYVVDYYPDNSILEFTNKSRVTRAILMIVNLFLSYSFILRTTKIQDKYWNTYDNKTNHLKRTDQATCIMRMIFLYLISDFFGSIHRFFWIVKFLFQF